MNGNEPEFSILQRTLDYHETSPFQDFPTVEDEEMDDLFKIIKKLMKGKRV